MSHSKCNLQYNVCNDVLPGCMFSFTHTHTYAQPRTFSQYSTENESMCVRVMSCTLSYIHGLYTLLHSLSYIHTFSNAHRRLCCTSKVDRPPFFSFPDSRYTKTHARARPNVYVDVYVCAPHMPDMYAYTPPRFSVHTHTHEHAHTQTHTHIYTHKTHTHTHTNI